MASCGQAKGIFFLLYGLTRFHGTLPHPSLSCEQPVTCGIAYVQEAAMCSTRKPDDE